MYNKGMLVINKELNNMDNLNNLKIERTKYLKAYRNCRPLENQTNQEFAEMQNGFAKKYAEINKQIKKIQRNIRESK